MPCSWLRYTSRLNLSVRPAAALMKKIGPFLVDYFVPLLFAFFALDIYLGDPYTSVSKSIPIIPGEHRDEWASGFFAVALFLGLIIYRYKHKRDADEQS